MSASGTRPTASMRATTRQSTAACRPSASARPARSSRSPRRATRRGKDWDKRLTGGRDWRVAAFLIARSHPRGRGKGSNQRNHITDSYYISKGYKKLHAKYKIQLRGTGNAVIRMPRAQQPVRARAGARSRHATPLSNDKKLTGLDPK